MKKIFLFALAALTLGFTACVEDDVYKGINDVSQTPGAVTPDDVVRVTATTTGISALTLKYTAGTAAEESVAMASSKESNSTFFADIPKQADGTTVKYYVEGEGQRSATKEYTVNAIVVDYNKLVLNEVNGTGADADKYIELYNNADYEIPLAGVLIKYGTVGSMKDSWTGQAADKIASKGYFVIQGAKGTYPSLSTGLSAGKNVIVEMYKGETQIDRLQRGPGDDSSATPTVKSMGRSPDGTGSWYFMDGTKNAANPASTGLSPVPHS